MSWPVTASRKLASMARTGESFRLILVERIALAVAAEADHLAQMLERDEMLAPQVVQRLQQHHLLDLAHDVSAPNLAAFFAGSLVGRLHAAAR